MAISLGTNAVVVTSVHCFLLRPVLPNTNICNRYTVTISWKSQVLKCSFMKTRETDFFSLILSSLQTKPNTCANSVDPDEMARNEPSHQDLHCFYYYYYYFKWKLLVYISGHVHVQGWMSPFQKFVDERFIKFNERSSSIINVYMAYKFV